MGKSRRRRQYDQPAGFWAQELGGAPYWFIAASLAVLVGIVGVVALNPQTPPTAASTPRPVPTFTHAARTPIPDVTIDLTVIGDSFTGGSSQDSGDGYRWRDLIAENGYTVHSLHEGGTGYVITRETGEGASNFVTRVESVAEGTQHLVFFGSVNDAVAGYDAVYSAATEAFGAAADRALDILVIGPASPVWPVASEMISARDAVRDAASDAGLDFIDPIEAGWFSENPDLIGPDGTHPNDAGHVYLAQMLTDVLDERHR